MKYLPKTLQYVSVREKKTFLYLNLWNVTAPE